MKNNKCDCCGKFRKEDHLCGMWGEGNDMWTECVFCMSVNDLEMYFKNKPEIIEMVKDKQ